MGEVIDQALTYLREKWHRKSAIVVLCSVLVIAYVYAIPQRPDLSTGEYVGLVALLVLAVSAWTWTNAWPKAKKGKEGFVIAIRATSEEDRTKVAEDFTETVRRLITGGALGSQFQFIVVPKHRLESALDLEAARTALRKTRSRFLIYGDVRRRHVTGEEVHVLRLDGVVSHGPASHNTVKRLGTEFRELLPPQIRFAVDDELTGFEATSLTVDVVARYIIGIAAIISREYQKAEVIYRDLRSRVMNSPSDAPWVKLIKQRIPTRLFEIHFVRAWDYYQDWLSGSSAAATRMSEQIQLIPKLFRDKYNVKLMRAMAAFLETWSTVQPRAILRGIKSRDPVWRYNVAFLEAFDGRLERVDKMFRKIARLPVDKAIPGRTEVFTTRVLEQDPTRCGLHYYLGLLNWKVKGDLELAAHCFETFLNESAGGDLDRLRSRCTALLATLRNEIEKVAS